MDGDDGLDSGDREDHPADLAVGEPDGDGTGLGCMVASLFGLTATLVAMALYLAFGEG